jgi:hypothetical protein
VCWRIDLEVPDAPLPMAQRDRNCINSHSLSVAACPSRKHVEEPWLTLDDGQIVDVLEQARCHTEET